MALPHDWILKPQITDFLRTALFICGPSNKCGSAGGCETVPASLHGNEPAIVILAEKALCGWELRSKIART
jgi:hypothetical protein